MIKVENQVEFCILLFDVLLTVHGKQKMLFYFILSFARYIIWANVELGLQLKVSTISLFQYQYNRDFF
jgi:hypothetical protein